MQVLYDNLAAGRMANLYCIKYFFLFEFCLKAYKFMLYLLSLRDTYMLDPGFA